MWTINAKAFFTLTALGIVTILVSVPLYLGRVKPNRIYGFRTRKAFESERNWYRINRYGAGAMICWSLILIVAGTLCLFADAGAVPAVTQVGILSTVCDRGATPWSESPGKSSKAFPAWSASRTTSHPSRLQP